MVRLRRRLPVLVKDVMVSPPVTVKGREPLREAAKAMYESRVGSVLVVDEEGRLRGILTERDVVYATAEGFPGDTPVWEIMTEKPIVARPEEPLSEALKKMRSAGVRHLPVVDDGETPIGIVSLRDLLEALIALLGLFGAL